MFVLLLALVAAQAPEPCLERYQALHPHCPGRAGCPSTEQEACSRLVGALPVEPSRLGLSLREDEALDVIPREAVQPVLGAGVAGTPGQVDATVSVRPVGLVGASLGVVSNGTDRVALLSFSVNPLAISSEDPGSFARLSRLFDVGLVLPAPILDSPTPEFFGLRANVDFVGAAVARRQLAPLSAAALQAQQEVLATGNELREDLRQALDALPPEQRARCLAALFGTGTTLGAVATACSTELPVRLRTAALATPRLQKALDDFEDAADGSQGGLNVQVDIPTDRSSNVPFRAALLGSGTLGLFTDVQSPLRVEAMASLGPDYLSQDGDGAVGGTLAAALGVRARLFRGMPRLGASLGLRGHLGQESDARVLSVASRPGDYLQAQAGVTLPIARTGLALSGGLNWTLAGEESGQMAFAMSLLYSLPGRER